MQHLVGREPVAVDLRVHEDAHEVVGRFLLARRDGMRAERRVFRHRVHRGHELLVGGAPALRTDEVVGPAQQIVAVFGCDAEHVADQDHRERRGDVAHEIALALLADLVDDRVGDGADLGLAGPYSTRREPLVDELAPLPVLGIVHVDHHRDRAVVRSDATRVRERGGVLGRAEHRGV